MDTTVSEVELPLDSVGTLLMRAREKAGLTRIQLAERTRIADRLLAAIEGGDYAALPSRAYAVGFSRSYAKAVGLDPNAVVDQVRSELARQEPDDARRTVPAFEPGDPARLPGARLGWIAAAGVAAVLVLGFVAWPSLYSPAGTLPSILAPEAAAPVAPAQAAIAQPAPVAGGAVVFTATRDKVWVRFADATGSQLMQKELALGESWTVPAGLEGVTLTTARPDGLAVTVGGQAVPPISTTEQVMRDVPVTAAALLARGSIPAQPVAAAPAPTAVAAREAATAAPRMQRPQPRRTEAVPAVADPAPPAAASPVPVTPAPAPTTLATTAQ